jgi:hypothetical protein
VTWLACDAAHLPFHDEYFDFALDKVATVLYHLCFEQELWRCVFEWGGGIKGRMCTYITHVQGTVDALVCDEPEEETVARLFNGLSSLPPSPLPSLPQIPSTLPPSLHHYHHRHHRLKPECVHRILLETHRVLKIGGSFLVVTHSPPPMRQGNLPSPSSHCRLLPYCLEGPLSSSTVSLPTCCLSYTLLSLPSPQRL